MGRVHVVTGGGSGIGRAVAEALPREDTVVITSRTLAKLERTAGTLNEKGRHIVAATCDVSSREEVRTLAEKAAGLGSVATVIHAAGISGSMGTPERIIRINALGTVYVNQEFFKAMDGGVIVDVASNSGYMLPRAMIPRRSYPLALSDENAFVRRLVRRASVMHNKAVDPQMAYMISKNFARWYSAGCALKYMRQRGIRVFSVSPGYVETPMTEKEKGKATDILLSYTGPKRSARPEELAHLIVSLADERCGYLMGTDVLCDGGSIAAGYKLTVATGEKRRPPEGGRW